MQFVKIAVLAFVSFAAANPLPEEAATEQTLAPAANCNGNIGNCYDNGCDGNPTTLVCLAGNYVGCPCGFNCNGRGPCNGGGCNGVNGRCTANFLGCSCG